MLSAASVDIDDEVKRRFEGIYLSVRDAEVTVTSTYNITKPLEALIGQINYDLETIKDNPIIRAYRDFYWRIGIDPTKLRPASEALMRRFLKNHIFPRINNIVDAGNIASMETLVPIGLYDMAKIEGKSVLRFAVTGEQFTDITGKTENLGRNKIVLADKIGVLHLFPHRDSQRTIIHPDTKRILIVGCGVTGVPRSVVDAAAERVVSLSKELQ